MRETKRSAKPWRAAAGPWVVAAGIAVVLLPVSLKEIQWAYHNQGDGFAGDYHVAVYSASQGVLHGVSPYGPPDSPLLGGSVENYPPTIFVALVPINWLPWRAAGIIWLLALGGMVVSTLAVLGVRDPPIYALWLFSAPSVAGMLWGNVTLAIIFATALLWRWRVRPRHAGIVLGAAIAIKLLAAPLLLWLVATRRFRAAALAVISALTMLLAAWAAISFEGMRHYPELISTASRLQVGNGLLLSGFVSHLGAGPRLAELVGVAAAAVSAAGAWRFRRDDRACFALMVLALQFATPIYHVFNLGFLVIPIAVMLADLEWSWVLLPTVWFASHVGPLTTGDYVSLSAAGFGTALTLVVASFVVFTATGPGRLDVPRAVGPAS